MIGRQLANFRIERAVRQDRAFHTYFGWDVKLHRPVVIKLIHVLDLDEAIFAQRLMIVQRALLEVREVSKWRHEHIAPVYYAGDEDGLYYFVSEHIEGLDLALLLSQYGAEGQLMPRDDALRIGRAIASALDFAHGRGLMHRGVRPSNVLLAGDGRVLLGDFGLAWSSLLIAGPESARVARYLAPEQVGHTAGAVPQSDLYSLALTLYEMLTGLLPPGASVADQASGRPSPHVAALGPETEAVFRRALSQAPGQRYPSGGELMEALAGALPAKPASTETAARLPQQGSSASAPLPLASTPVAERVAVYLKENPNRYSGPELAGPADSSPRLPPAGGVPAASPRKNPAAFLVAGIALSIAILVIGIALIVRQARVGSPGLPTLVVEATQPPSSTTQADAGIGQFALYYDQNSLYLRNISGDTPSLQALAFERLDASGTPLNRFDGANWAKFYPRLEAGWCVRLEIIDSPAWLRPAECGNRYRSTRTPNRDSDWIFWTPQEASLEFRVLWQGDEVVRCEIAAGTCSFDLR